MYATHTRYVIHAACVQQEVNVGCNSEFTASLLEKKSMSICRCIRINIQFGEKEHVLLLEELTHAFPYAHNSRLLQNAAYDSRATRSVMCNNCNCTFLFILRFSLLLLYFLILVIKKKNVYTMSVFYYFGFGNCRKSTNILSYTLAIVKVAATAAEAATS